MEKRARGVTTSLGGYDNRVLVWGWTRRHVEGFKIIRKVYSPFSCQM
jgi:hypothetical protein